MFKRKRISLAEARAVLAAFHRIPIRMVDLDLDRSLELAGRLNVYAYVIACALNTDTPLLSEPVYEDYWWAANDALGVALHRRCGRIDSSRALSAPFSLVFAFTLTSQTGSHSMEDSGKRRGRQVLLSSNSPWVDNHDRLYIFRGTSAALVRAR